MMMRMMQILPELLRGSGENNKAGLLVFFFFGLIFFLLGMFLGVRQHLRCTLKVSAQCVDLVERRTRKGSRLYAPVWEYEAQGRYITITDSTASNFNVPKVGKTYTLYVDPDEPEKSRRKGLSSYFIIAFCGAFFMFMALWAGSMV